MSKHALLLALAVSLICSDASAQVDYRRSSLHLILMEGETFPNKTVVMDAYNKHPFPDKYNDHTIGIKSFNPDDYKLTDAEKQASGTSKSKLGAITSKAVDSGSGGVVNGDAADMPFQINKFLEKNDVAKKMVAKWFNRKPDGSMDFELVKARGLYAASAQEVGLSNYAASKEDQLIRDFDLFGNSFVVINKQTFISNEVAAGIIRTAALNDANSITNELLRQKAIETAEKIYEKTKEGYTVLTKAWLYQLVWNEEVANNTYARFFNSGVTAEARKAFWDTTSMYKLQLVGDEVASSLVTFSLKTKRTEEEIIRLAVSRNVDNVYAKLQKKYEVFRPVTRIASVGDGVVTALIGMKEGVEPGQTFEILEPVTNDLGINTYKSIGTVKVSNKLPVWDNRAGAMEEPELDEAGNPIVTPEYTTFDGGKKTQAGFHYLRLKK